MLFASFGFIFVFLPLVLGAHFAALRYGGPRAAVAVLTASSFCFYAWWNSRYLVLIAASIAFNYACSLCLTRPAGRGKGWILALGVAGNLAALGYFKYAGFLATAANGLLGLGWSVPRIVLPLAISFFTFQQIDFLVDTWTGQAPRQRLLDYCLYVTFFPHLIAGPILRHDEMLPQFARLPRFSQMDLSLGLSAFVVGLAKKVLLADGLATYASPVFDATAAGGAVTFVEAWAGATAYALQLYFDFSGYSDMALGVARMLGIRLPLNFNSPYKAASMIEFWQRWHLTLTRLLATYLYNPITLAMVRRRVTRRLPLLKPGRSSPAAFATLLVLPTMVTMGLAGVWHGAGSQFLVFGLLHGFYLVVNHAWRVVRPAAQRATPTARGRLAGQLLTFAAVVFAFVFFRSESAAAAWRMVEGMAGVNGVQLPPVWGRRFGGALGVVSRLGVRFQRDLFQGGWQVIWMAAALAVAWLLPNTQQILGRYLNRRPEADEAARAPIVYEIPAFPGSWAWRPSLLWAGVGAVLAAVSVLRLEYAAAFLYFDF
jgi:D-alanyl-lipoteichoic acid acyltransferase DltB (MBOAT superfamily)